MDSVVPLSKPYVHRAGKPAEATVNIPQTSAPPDYTNTIIEAAAAVVFAILVATAILILKKR